MSGFPEILYEDNHLLIVNKRPGDIVQADKTGDVALIDILKKYIKEKYHKPGEVFLGLVHRIDRPVSGAVIFARTSKALTRLTTMVKNREINKTYWAIVEKIPDPLQGRLENYLIKNEKQNKSYLVPKEGKDAKLAVLDYRLIASSTSLHLLKVELITGRHHQIRAQLAAIKCYIRGDLKYGAKRSNPDGSICLHSRELNFAHPVSGEKLRIVAGVPSLPEWKYFDI